MPDGRRGTGIVSMRASGVAPVMNARLVATTGIIPFAPRPTPTELPAVLPMTVWERTTADTGCV